MKIKYEDIFEGLKNIFKVPIESIFTEERINQLKSAGRTDDQINEMKEKVNEEMNEKANENAQKWTNLFRDTFAGRIKKDGYYYDLVDSTTIKPKVDNDNLKLETYLNVKIVQSNYNIGQDDVIILVNSVSNVTVTLPNVSSNGKFYVIKNVGTGSVTVTPSGSSTIDGLSYVILNMKNQTIEIVSDGSNWYIIGSYQGGV